MVLHTPARPVFVGRALKSAMLQCILYQTPGEPSEVRVRDLGVWGRGTLGGWRRVRFPFQILLLCLPHPERGPEMLALPRLSPVTLCTLLTFSESQFLVYRQVLCVLKAKCTHVGHRAGRRSNPPPTPRAVLALCF